MLFHKITLSLSDRCNELCKDLFLQIQNPNHKLNCLLPVKRHININLRKPILYRIPSCFSERYKNSLAPYIAKATFNNVSKINLSYCFNSYGRLPYSFVPVFYGSYSV